MKRYVDFRQGPDALTGSVHDGPTGYYPGFGSLRQRCDRDGSAGLSADGKKIDQRCGRMVLLWALWISVWLLTAHVPSVHADGEPRIVDGTRFEPVVTVEEFRLEIKGTALLRYLKLIKAYVGALYLPPDTPGSQALDDLPRRLVLEYRVAISAEDFAKATRESIRKNESPELFQTLEADIEALNRLYRDVSAGDRYALTYLPGKGTELSLNGQPLGTLEGAAFSRALFAIWIGDTPIDKTFRDRLLGERP